jgi:CO dehydrogenase maturation factor
MTTIALTGKGGTGKTTVAALMVTWLVANGKTPVLAVDADPNANLNEALGVDYSATVGGIREDARAKAASMAGGLSKQQFLETQVNRALVESKGFDLVVMGRPEGPGCYCFANNVLRDVLARISNGYPFTVVDCEAGLEHLSRRTLLTVDWLIAVSDPSIRGIRSAGRVGDVVDEMRTRVRHRALAVNMMRNGTGMLNDAQEKAVEESGLDRVFFLPLDDQIRMMDENGGSVKDIKSDGMIYEGVDRMMKEILE